MTFRLQRLIAAATLPLLEAVADLLVGGGRSVSCGIGHSRDQRQQSPPMPCRPYRVPPHRIERSGRL